MPESIYHRPHHGLDDMTEKTHIPSGTSPQRPGPDQVEGLDIDTISATILPILKKHGVRRAGLFGSFVRGEASGDSDIDILVEVDDEASLLDFVGIKLDLEDALGIKVDLVEYSAIDPRLRDRILAEEVVIL
jgi:predicted nucleotidyltransferase